MRGIEPAARYAHRAMSEYDAGNGRRALHHEGEPHQVAALAGRCPEIVGQPEILRIDSAEAPRVLVSHELENVCGPFRARLESEIQD